MGASGGGADARMTLSGLMSRWRMPRSWACWAASASAAAQAAAILAETGWVWALSHWRRLGPAANSAAMK